MAICTMGSEDHKNNTRLMSVFSDCRNLLLLKIFVLTLTIFRKGELEHRGDEEGQRAFGVVDFSAALTQPPCLGLVSYLIEAAVLSCHKDASQVCGGDGQDVDVVCGD